MEVHVVLLCLTVYFHCRKKARSHLVTSQWKPTTTAANHYSALGIILLHFCSGPDPWPMTLIFDPRRDICLRPTHKQKSRSEVRQFKRESGNKGTDTTDFIIFLANSLYWYSITHSLFHSRLKSFLFCKSSLPQPFLFSPSGFTIWISQTVYCYFWAYSSFYFF